jgi:hypothetical protein
LALSVSFIDFSEEEVLEDVEKEAEDDEEEVEAEEEEEERDEEPLGPLLLLPPLFPASLVKSVSTSDGRRSRVAPSRLRFP